MPEMQSQPMKDMMWVLRLRLEGEIPSHAYGLDIMEDNTVTLIEINYPCWGSVEGFLGYEGRKIHFGLPK